MGWWSCVNITASVPLRTWRCVPSSVKQPTSGQLHNHSPPHATCAVTTELTAARSAAGGCQGAAAAAAGRPAGGRAAVGGHAEDRGVAGPGRRDAHRAARRRHAGGNGGPRHGLRAGGAAGARGGAAAALRRHSGGWRQPVVGCCLHSMLRNLAETELSWCGGDGSGPASVDHCKHVQVPSGSVALPQRASQMNNMHCVLSCRAGRGRSCGG